MKTLNDYINAYSDVANRLGYTGESIRILIQLLANASYISEVENIAYTRESSLDKAMLMNSKIQHCMNNMYSVYRGHCPRVVLSVNFLRPVTFMPYDEIIRSSHFSVYFLGEYVKEKNEEDPMSLYKWTYKEGQISLTNSNLGQRYIVGFISPEKSVKTITTNTYQNYYIESNIGNVSNDVFVKISETGEMPRVSRNFAEHILDPQKNVFDLTTTDYGSRIYFADYYSQKGRGQLRWDEDVIEDENDSGITTNTEISATFYTYSSLNSYNPSELSRLTLKGGELIAFDEELDNSFLYGKYGYPDKGIVYISETNRDSLSTIHYKANKSRYLNTILRSNSDIGYILEESFPSKIKSGSTYYKFENYGGTNFLNIYYIPSAGTNLTEEELTEFKKNRLAYYVTDEDSISILSGVEWKAKFEITLELFKNVSEDYSELISKPMIQEPYAQKFNITFDENTVEEIKSRISKISNIKKISNFSITYSDEYGNLITDISEVDSIPESVYYKIEIAITTIVKS